MFRFMEAMGGFCEEARSQCDILQAMFKKMETSYCNLESYYVFDRQKYTLEEFMSDVKTFKNQEINLVSISCYWLHTDLE